MAKELGKIIADFQTSLAGKIAIGGVSGSLLSATDDDGVILPDGRYFFTIDSDNSSKEHISCDLVGTTKAITNIKTVARGTGVETVGTLREHRIGATVTITDFAHIKKLNDLLDGTTDLDSDTPLKYDGDPTINDDKELATKKYADDLAIAGSPDMTLTVKGIGEEATAAEINAGTQTGGTGAELVVNPKYLKDSEYYTQRPTAGEKAGLAGNNTDIAVGAGNKLVTQTGLQHNAEKYAADAGDNDNYVITLDPIPTSYTNGMVVHFKANTINTGACTLNVNSLGAKAIVKNYNVALDDGDIKAGQLVSVIYDGTNFQMLSPVGNNQTPPTTYYVNGGSGGYSSPHTLVTQEIGANTMGANGLVKLNFPVTINIGNVSGALTIRLKSGSTTISTIQISIPAQGGGSTTTALGQIVGFIKNNNNTAIQVGYFGSFTAPVAAGSNTVYASPALGVVSGTIDTTTAQTISIEVEGSSYSINIGDGIIEVIKQ